MSLFTREGCEHSSRALNVTVTVSFHSERVVLEYGAKIRENIPTELYSHVVKAQFSGDKIPYSDDELYIVISMFVFSFFVCFFTLRMRKHTSGDCRLSELVLSDSDYTTARYLSLDSKIVSLCVEQTGEVKRLTVAGSR